MAQFWFSLSGARTTSGCTQYPGCTSYHTPFAGGAAQTNQVEIEHEAREQTLDDPDVSHLDEIEELDQDP